MSTKLHSSLAPQNDVAFWRLQAIRLERDARHVKLATAAMALVTLVLGFSPLPAVAAFVLGATTASVGAIGSYMVMVRRQECAMGLDEAQKRVSSSGKD